jgi:organic hydroperoxide reductase OsmC/OhrA
MAKVITVEVPRGEFFGGSGAAVFHPYRTKRSEPAPAAGATPEELLAAAAEACLLRLVSATEQLQPSTPPNGNQ